MDFESIENIKDMGAVILAIAHNEFMGLSMDKLNGFFQDVPNENRVVIDVKGLLDRREYEAAGYRYWRL